MKTCARQKQPRATAAELQALRTQLPAVDLRPGEMHIAEQPTLISTVLGSCVSVCLFSLEKKLAAVSHCVLPAQKRSPSRRDNPYSCVDSCVRTMLETLTRKHHVPRHTIKAKLFGGASVLQAGAETATIGAQNITAAREALRKHAVELVAECVGGEQGYKLFFHSETGEAFLRQAKKSRLEEQRG